MDKILSILGSPIFWFFVIVIVIALGAKYFGRKEKKPGVEIEAKLPALVGFASKILPRSWQEFQDHFGVTIAVIGLFIAVRIALPGFWHYMVTYQKGLFWTLIIGLPMTGFILNVFQPWAVRWTRRLYKAIWTVVVLLSLVSLLFGLHKISPETRMAGEIRQDHIDLQLKPIKAALKRLEGQVQEHQPLTQAQFDSLEMLSAKAASIRSAESPSERLSPFESFLKSKTGSSLTGIRINSPPVKILIWFVGVLIILLLSSKKVERWKRFVFILFLSAFVYWGIPALAEMMEDSQFGAREHGAGQIEPLVTQNSDGTIEIIFPASYSGWYDTGLKNPRIEAKGTIDHGGIVCGPEGSGIIIDGSALVPNLPFGTLVATEKKGGKQKFVPVGYFRNIHSEDNVRIAINDSYYGDNKESYIIKLVPL